MKVDDQIIVFFREKLQQWAETHHRPLPWKGEKDPYLIWLSEILLQQTRVEQGMPYFERFRDCYPTVQALASAPEDEIMKLWEGLGYYSRARNMHQAAKQIVKRSQGTFPQSYKQILALKGVGPYTAAAIASFAFDLPHAVLDGNVFRVLSRFLGLKEAIDSTAGRKLFCDLADQLLDRRSPGKYNQAIMDFGAVHCKPRNPDCKACLMAPRCAAFLEDRVDELPVKSRRLKRKERFFNYLIINQRDKVWLRKRTSRDIWRHLYEFPLLELDGPAEGPADVTGSPYWRQLICSQPYQLSGMSKPFRQTLTHQQIIAVFWEIEVNENFKINENHYFKENRKNLRKFAFPKIIDWYLRDNLLYLNLL